MTIRNTVYSIGMAVLVLILMGGSVFFYLQYQRSVKDYRREQVASGQWEQKWQIVQKETMTLEKKNAELTSELTGYTDQNTRLLAENEKFKKTLEEIDTLKQRIHQKEMRIQELAQAKTEDASTQQKISESIRHKEKIASAQMSALHRQIRSLRGTLASTRGLYHYNLAVAYSKADLFPQAIAAYQKSLEFDPRDADAHYNLAVLFAEVEKNPLLAVSHYQRYLELKPDTEDRKEIEKQISGLTAMSQDKAPAP